VALFFLNDYELRVLQITNQLQIYELQMLRIYKLNYELRIMKYEVRIMNYKY